MSVMHPFLHEIGLKSAVSTVDTRGKRVCKRLEKRVDKRRNPANKGIPCDPSTHPALVSTVDTLETIHAIIIRNPL